MKVFVVYDDYELAQVTNAVAQPYDLIIYDDTCNKGRPRTWMQAMYLIDAIKANQKREAEHLKNQNAAKR